MEQIERAMSALEGHSNHPRRGTENGRGKPLLHQWVEDHAERAPEAVAVQFGAEFLTYRQLNERANQLAWRLRALGVGAETLVGICMERSLELIVGLLGILKAGGAYVPLDPEYPAERLVFILEDAHIPVVVTHSRRCDRLATPAESLVFLDSDETLARESTANPDAITTPANLAYVIYTSGSTGSPKGVQVCLESVFHLFEVTRPLFDFTDRDVWTMFHSYAFDLSVWEIWGCLVHGGRLVVVSGAVARSPRDFSELLVAEGVTILSQTPSALRQLVNYRKANRDRPIADDAALRAIVCGGEALPPALAQVLLDWELPLWNFYGPTEATVWAIAGRVQRGDPETGTVPVGDPFRDVEVLLLDENSQPVPDGSPGELYLGGVCLARGYLNRPELTAQAFIRNPFGQEANARFYKTGDLARRRADGRVEFLGRMDHQIKLNGFRIELGEIEAALDQHPAVRESVVLAREDIGEDRRLVAYFVCHPGSVCIPAELPGFLGAKLPAHFIPAAFVRISSLPLTPNGKVDRKALPPPRAECAERAAQPIDLLHEQITAIWEQVLQFRPIGLHDSFFDLGGNSLSAADIAVAIENKCAVRVPLGAAFEFPTIARLAARLRAGPISAHDAETVRLNATGTKPPFFFVNGLVGLGHFLGNDQPFFAINVPLPENVTDGNSAIEDMARRCIEIMRQIQPRGPYRLGGYSLGGPVAFEMCHQLHLQHESVALLALVDPDPPKPTPAGRMQRNLNLLATIARNLLQLRMSEKLAYARECTRRGRARLLRTPRAIERVSEPVAEMTWQDRMTALEGSYDPPRVPARAALFLATHQYQESRRPHRDPRLEWRKALTQKTEIFRIDGDHASLGAEPQLRLIAEYLRTQLSVGLFFSSLIFV